MCKNFELRKTETEGCLDLHLLAVPVSLTHALDLSIEKWEFIAEYHKRKRTAPMIDEFGAESCALCEMFPEAFSCEGCPIDKVTQEGCSYTPYSEYVWATNHKEKRQAALNFVEFLKTLKD